MPRKIKQIILPAMAVVVVLVFAAFASREKSDVSCSNIETSIEGAETGKTFLTREEIEKIITADGSRHLVGMKLFDLPLNTLEADLRKNPFVKQVEIYTNLEGTLVVKVWQREPIARLISLQGQQYYLDAEGNEMPVSQHASAHVPVIVLETGSKLLKTDSIRININAYVFSLVKELANDNFVYALTGEIRLHTNRDVTLYPRIGSLRIELGDTADLADKFLRLRNFYSKSLPTEGWDTWSEINLKFKNQVIAKRTHNG